MEPQQHIELSKDQFLTLAKMVYLGNWVANSHNVPSPEGEEGGYLKEYDNLSDYIFSLAPSFGLSANLEHELEWNPSSLAPDEEYVPTEIENLIEEYEDAIFWTEFCEQLGERDFYQMYSDEDIKVMSDEDRFVKLQECIIKYENETEERGLERFQVMKTIEDFGIEL